MCVNVVCWYSRLAKRQLAKRQLKQKRENGQTALGGYFDHIFDKQELIYTQRVYDDHTTTGWSDSERGWQCRRRNGRA